MWNFTKRGGGRLKFCSVREVDTRWLIWVDGRPKKNPLSFYSRIEVLELFGFLGVFSARENPHNAQKQDLRRPPSNHRSRNKLIGKGARDQCRTSCLHMSTTKILFGSFKVEGHVSFKDGLQDINDNPRRCTYRS